jgi:plastocyanin
MLSMSRLRFAVPVALVAVAALVPAAADAGRTAKVQVASNYFAPATVTAKAGDKVRFTWPADGFVMHDVRVRKGPEKFRSPLQRSGTWTHRVKRAGTYTLYCSQHAGMTMKLVVKKR